MKRRAFLLAPLAAFLSPVLFAQPDRPPEPPVPVTQARPDRTPQQALLTPPAGENQKVYGSQSALISAEAAQALSEKFRAAYGQTSSPRIVIHVNRALVDTNAGLRLTGRTEKYHESTSTRKGAEPETSSDKSGENTYSAGEEAKALTLADQQTVREIERLFGRVFRNAGAKLADQRAAAALLADQPGAPIGTDPSVKEREALKQIADIAIEVLISSRPLTVNGISGETTYTVPDIQTTAIRLSDSTILGQAAASDVIGGGAAAGGIARKFGAQDITEATAFALMEDMLTGTK